MDTSGPAPATGPPVDRDSAGTEIQKLRNELALVKEQLLNATAQRDSFERVVVQMRKHTLTAEVRDQHQRTHALDGTLTTQITASQDRIRQLEADLTSAHVALGWPPQKK